MRRSPRPTRPAAALQSGFTLVEMLLAITLMAMIMALAYQGLAAGTRAVDRGEAAVDRTNRLRVVQQFLRNQISRTLPLALPVEYDDEEGALVIFDGDDARLDFVAPMPGYLDRGGPQHQVLALRRGETGLELLFAHQMLNSREDRDPLDDPDRPPTVLLDGIASGHFEYLSVDDEGEPTEWLDDWEDPSITPLMVRIELEMEASSRLAWPTLEVAPLIDGSATRRNRSIIIPGGGGTPRRGEQQE